MTVRPERCREVSMRSTAGWDDLRRILDDERRAYAALVALLEREQRALRRMDRQALQELNDSKEGILDTIAVHGRKRMACLKDLTGCEDPRSAGERVLQDVDPRAASAKAAFEELMTLGARAKVLVEENRALTARGLSLVRGAWQVVTESLTGHAYGVPGRRSPVPASVAIDLRG